MIFFAFCYEKIWKLHFLSYICTVELWYIKIKYRSKYTSADGIFLLKNVLCQNVNY